MDEITLRVYYTFEMNGIELLMTSCDWVGGKMWISSIDRCGRTSDPFEPCSGMVFTGSVDSIDYWLRR